MKTRKLEELLETVFTEREQGRDQVESVLAHAFEGHAPGKGPEDFHELARLGLVQFDGAQIALTPEGEQRAAEVVRRHRLAERLFTDLLALDETQTEQQACEVEHVLSAEATDSVCTLLGHPPSCPHGKPIPAGPCCAAFSRTVKPLVTALAALPLGSRGRIAFLAPRWAERMDRLASLGVMPGTVVRLKQRAPSVVIESGETTLALDPEIAAAIYVKPVA
ncbi:MAG: metal-dependent transcriptional regulator [Deltaproteobacteria bacterium]